MLAHLNAGMLKLLVGVMIAMFGGFFIAKPSFKRLQKDHKLADSAVGFIGGVLGHLPGCPGPCQQFGVHFITGIKVNNALYCSPLMF